VSDRTLFNIETLDQIKKRAKKKGLRVTVIGQDVFEHPPGVRIPRSRRVNPDNKKDPYSKYWILWAMEW